MNVRLGCFSLLLVLVLAVALSFFFVGIFSTALVKLHLTPLAALIVLTGILAGSLVNIPVKRIGRTETVLVDYGAVFGLLGMWPRLQRIRRETIVAVNVGGCLVPVGLALYQLAFLTRDAVMLGSLPRSTFLR